MTNIRDIIPPCPLNDEETRILELLLSVSFPGHDELPAQLPHAQVSGESSCCPTLELTVSGGAAAPARVAKRVPVEAAGTASDRLPIEILVHVVDGYLHELELVHFGLNHPLAFPVIEKIEAQDRKE